MQLAFTATCFVEEFSLLERSQKKLKLFLEFEVFVAKVRKSVDVKNVCENLAAIGLCFMQSPSSNKE